MIVEKIFTKEIKNNIINQKYNPLNKDESFYEREGLFMRGTKDIVLDEVVKELREKYNKKEQVIKIMLEECKKLGYNIKESKEIIIDFFKCN